MPVNGFSKVTTLALVMCVLLAVGGSWVLWRETQPAGQRLPIPFQQSWTHTRALQEALTQNSPSICEKVNESYTVQDFVVSAKQARDNCKVTYATKKQDTSYCMSLPSTRDSNNWSLRDGCLQQLAMDLQRPELCDEMPSINDPDYGQTWLEQCREAAASGAMILPKGDIATPIP